MDAVRKMSENDNVRSSCGVVAIDKHGNFGKACTTELMPWASIAEGQMDSGMHPEETNPELL